MIIRYRMNKHRHTHTYICIYIYIYIYSRIYNEYNQDQRRICVCVDGKRKKGTRKLPFRCGAWTYSPWILLTCLTELCSLELIFVMR